MISFANSLKWQKQLFLEGLEQGCGLKGPSFFLWWDLSADGPVFLIIRQIGDYIKVSSLIISWAYLWMFHGLVFQRRSPTQSMTFAVFPRWVGSLEGESLFIPGPAELCCFDSMGLLFLFTQELLHVVFVLSFLSIR